MSVAPSSSKAPTSNPKIRALFAQCQFHPTDENDFIKHAQTHHCAGISFWCNKCHKCFSSASITVLHIKEANCMKEKIINRCSPDGKAFVHFRQCNRGNSSVHCDVHCSKVFTLPHNFILQNQNEFSFREKNRKTYSKQTPAEIESPAMPASTSGSQTTPITTLLKAAPISTSENNATQVMRISVKQKPCVINVTQTFPAASVAPVVASPKQVSTLQDRASTKGHRARDSRNNYFNSDSKDSDDPSWCPKETFQFQLLKQYVHSAGQTINIKNPDSEESDLLTEKSRNPSEQLVSKTVLCSCCDFSTILESLLEEHCVASHKHTKGNSCLIGNRKFEHFDVFTQYFYLHEKDIVVSEEAISERSNDLSKPGNVVLKDKLAEETSVNTSTRKETSVSTSANKTPPHVMQTSVEQKPCLADAPRTLPAVPVASVVASPREVSNLQGYTSMKGHCTQNSGINYFDSDSDDPDDPSWCPEETSQSRPLRQSANLASEITDIKNLDLGKSDLLTNKSRNSFEQPVSKTVTCPCCDFSTVLESLLREHYVASHKHTKENSCLICNRKFEHVDLFTQHFYLHEKDIVLSEEDVSESSNDSSKLEFIAKNKPDKKTSKSSKFYNSISLECIPGKAVEDLGPSVLQISNQTARQEKLAKKSKVKSFEDLKSNTAVVKMRLELKLKHFFKCTVLNCTFTTDDCKFYLCHLNECHKHKKLHCTYCIQEFSEAQVLIEHMFKEHIERCYQCSVCFYRAVSKPHVQIHIRNNHKTEKACVYSCSLHLPPNYKFSKKSTTDLVTTYPYICAVSDCKYQSFHPKEFTKHTNLNHQNVSQLPCHYCEHDFFSMKELVSHYQLHEINIFQCKHCFHGSETKEEILLHICNAHADKPFKILVRDSQEVELCKKPVNGIVKQNPIPVANLLPEKVITVEQDEEYLSSLLFQRNELEYPKEVLLMDKDFFCRMPSCEKECQNFNAYINHLKEDHSALNILCPYCSAVCKNSAIFENHVMCHGPNLYACSSEGCTLYSFLKTSVAKHLTNCQKVQSEVKVIREDLDRKLDRFKLTPFPKSKSKINFSICPFCYYETADVKLMKNHIYAEFFYKPFTCNVCKEKLCSYSEIKTHFTAFHQYQDVKFKVSGNLEIEFLTKIFLTSDVQNEFVEYLQSKDVAEEDILSIMSKYKCEECNLCYKNMADWQYHWVHCVLKENRPQTCNYCCEQFSYMNHLKHHTEKEHAGRHISCNPTENILLRQTTLRKLQFGKLQILKSMLIPFLKSKGLYCEKLNSFQLDFKWRTHLNDKFPCNDQNHIAGYHKDKSLVVSKVQNSVDIPKNCNDHSKMILVDSHTKAQSKNKPFICTFCDGKMQTRDELELHISSHDFAATDSYSFYYLADPKLDYSEKDTELYECAYCNVSPKNLFHLKRHYVNFHSRVPFKVRGNRFKGPPAIHCKHCDLTVMPWEVLEKHCLGVFHHFDRSTKSLNNDKQQLKRKGTDNVNGPLNKRLKGNSSKYQCGYCKESFQFYFQMITHHRAEHADVPLKFTKDPDSKYKDV